MSRKKSYTDKLKKRLKKQNLKKNPATNKPKYVSKAERALENTSPMASETE